MSDLCPKCQKPIDASTPTCPHCGNEVGYHTYGEETVKKLWHAIAGPPGNQVMVGHFAILVAGTLLFLFVFFNEGYIDFSHGVGATFALICQINHGVKLVAEYLAFVALVLGHGILRKKSQTPDVAESLEKPEGGHASSRTAEWRTQ